MDKMISGVQDGAAAAHIPSGSKARRLSGPVILVCCVFLAFAVVLVAPVLTGSQSVALAATPEQAATFYSTEVSYPSVEAASSALGFTPALPSQLPAGFTADAISVLDGEVFEQVYKNGKDEIIYRTARGNGDLGFIDTAFQYSATHDTDGISRTYEGGSEKKLSLSVWVNGDYSFAVVAPEGIPEADMRMVAEGVA